MKTISATLALVTVLLAGISSASIADKMMASKMAPVACPVCKMPMPAAKSKMMTVPVYIKADKTVHYCCPMCAAGKSAAAYHKMHHKAMPV